MNYIRLKKYGETKRMRKNGTRQMDLYYMEKTCKKGDELTNEFIPKSKDVVITGPASSGKSRTITRIHDHALDIWGGRPRIQIKVMLSGLQSITDWYENDDVMDYYENKKAEKPWYKLRATEKANLLIEYVSSKPSIVFIDDAHKLSNRKLDIALKCLYGAKRFFITTPCENSLAQTLKGYVLRSDPEIYSFKSEDSTIDYTSAIMWVFIVSFIAIDAYWFAMALGGLKFLGRGYGASRQN